VLGLETQAEMHGDMSVPSPSINSEAALGIPRFFLNLMRVLIIGEFQVVSEGGPAFSFR
jgi:hypothetical protein